MKELCQVLIFRVNEGNSYKGLITGLGAWKWIFFNPLYILPEICDNNGELVFSDYDLSDTINIENSIAMSNIERDQYNAVIGGIKHLINLCVNDNFSITPATIDFLRPYFGITVKLNPICMIGNPSPTTYPMFHYSSFTIDEVISGNSIVYHDYFFQCYSPSDILFSILHFLVINNYKFRKCDHCDRIFATQNLKVQYCSRLSEYPNFVHLHCADAVKNIRQDLRRTQTRMYRNIHAHQSPFVASKFTDAFDKAFDSVKKKSSYEAIRNCYKTLDKEKWYKSNAPRNVGEKRRP